VDSFGKVGHKAACRHGKTSLFSQLKADGSTNPGELLVDDSKESLVRSLGECLKEIELNGNYFGEFSLTVRFVQLTMLMPLLKLPLTQNTSLFLLAFGNLVLEKTTAKTPPSAAGHMVS
jgi:hypothetical protein